MKLSSEIYIQGMDNGDSKINRMKPVYCLKSEFTFQNRFIANAILSICFRISYRFLISHSSKLYTCSLNDEHTFCL